MSEGSEPRCHYDHHKTNGEVLPFCKQHPTERTVCGPFYCPECPRCNPFLFKPCLICKDKRVFCCC